MQPGGWSTAVNPFAAKREEHYHKIVALLKLGVDYASIMAMSTGEADNLLATWHKIVTPETGKTAKYRVKRD